MVRPRRTPNRRPPRFKPLNPLDHPNPQESARQKWLAALSLDLGERRAAGLFRELKTLQSSAGPEITLADRRLVQFSSNNYLGLANHPEVIAAAWEATEKWGTGSGASRLVSGSLEIHHALEAELAAFKRTEASLLFPTGFMANLAAITAFAGPGDRIVSDKLNHASLLDAARYSGADHRTFPHRSYARAGELLTRSETGRRFLVSDTVFSMDGDLADLPALSDAAEKGDALVILDEAHATGVLGETGAGLAEMQHVENRIALSVGTLSKALGSLGGFITGPRVAIDSLVNSARSFIYTTALPPACCAAALAALRLIRRDPAPRRRVLALAEHVRKEITAMGFSCGDSQTPIIPVILGTSEKALAAATFLLDRGLFVPAIRPPTVAPNAARLRISLMATHTDGQVEQLLAALRSWSTKQQD